MIQALRLHPAITTIHKDRGYPWTVQKLAEHVGMSRFVFALRFREIVGAASMEYVTRWRMLLAADRMKHQGEGIGTIARSFGCDSESAFGKAFRRVTGCTPRQYWDQRRSDGQLTPGMHVSPFPRMPGSDGLN